MNRWIIVVGAVLIQLCLGAIYAWSVFTPPLVAPLPDTTFQNTLDDGGISMMIDGELVVGSEQDFTITFVEDGTEVTDMTAVNVTLELRNADNEPVKSDKMIPYIGYVYEEGDPITEGPYTPVQAGSGYDFSAKVKKGGNWHFIVEAERNVDGNITTYTFEVNQQVATGEYGFSTTQSQMIFAAGLFIFAIFTIISGRLSKRYSPRALAIAGGVVLGFGYIFASFVGTSFIGLLITIGVLGGAGIGLAYVVPIGVGVKWFPDKKGLISGLAVAGFGFGALFWMKMATGFVFGPLKLTGDWGGLYEYFDVSTVFLIYGIAFLAAVTVGGFLMVNPPEGWKPEGWNPPEASEAKATGGTEFTSAEMRKTPQYYMLFFMFMIGAGAGLMVIGVIKLFGIWALQESGHTAAEAGVIAGTAMALFYSLANGFGRIAWGAFSEKVGRKMALAIMFGIQGLMMIAFYFMGGNEYLLYAGAAIVGFNFGGNFALFPAATADYFGNKSVGLNYGWVFFAYGIGGILGPTLGGIMGDNEMWMWAFIPAGIGCFVATALALLLKPPVKREDSETSQETEPAGGEEETGISEEEPESA